MKKLLGATIVSLALLLSPAKAAMLTSPGEYQLVGLDPSTQSVLISIGLTSLDIGSTPFPPWDIYNEVRVDFFASIIPQGQPGLSLYDWFTNCNHIGCNLDRGLHNYGNLTLNDPASVIDVYMSSTGQGSSEALMYFIYADGVQSNAQLAAVPEASTWAMMLLGFIGIALMRRRIATCQISFTQ